MLTRLRNNPRGEQETASGWSPRTSPTPRARKMLTRFRPTASFAKLLLLTLLVCEQGPLQAFAFWDGSFGKGVWDQLGQMFYSANQAESGSSPSSTSASSSTGAGDLTASPPSVEEPPKRYRLRGSRRKHRLAQEQAAEEQRRLQAGTRTGTNQAEDQHARGKDSATTSFLENGKESHEQDFSDGASSVTTSATTSEPAAHLHEVQVKVAAARPSTFTQGKTESRRSAGTVPGSVTTGAGEQNESSGSRLGAASPDAGPRESGISEGRPRPISESTSSTPAAPMEVARGEEINLDSDTTRNYKALMNSEPVVAAAALQKQDREQTVEDGLATSDASTSSVPMERAGERGPHIASSRPATFTQGKNRASDGLVGAGDGESTDGNKLSRARQLEVDDVEKRKTAPSTSSHSGTRKEHAERSHKTTRHNNKRPVKNYTTSVLQKESSDGPTSVISENTPSPPPSAFPSTREDSSMRYEDGIPVAPPADSSSTNFTEAEQRVASSRKKNDEFLDTSAGEREQQGTNMSGTSDEAAAFVENNMAARRRGGRKQLENGDVAGDDGEQQQTSGNANVFGATRKEMAEPENVNDPNYQENYHGHQQKLSRKAGAHQHQHRRKKPSSSSSAFLAQNRVPAKRRGRGTKRGGGPGAHRNTARRNHHGGAGEGGVPAGSYAYGAGSSRGINNYNSRNQHLNPDLSATSLDEDAAGPGGPGQEQEHDEDASAFLAPASKSGLSPRNARGPPGTQADYRPKHDGAGNLRGRQRQRASLAQKQQEHTRRRTRRNQPGSAAFHQSERGYHSRPPKGNRQGRRKSSAASFSFLENRRVAKTRNMHQHSHTAAATTGFTELLHHNERNNHRSGRTVQNHRTNKADYYHAHGSSHDHDLHQYHRGMATRGRHDDFSGEPRRAAAPRYHHGQHRSAHLSRSVEDEEDSVSLHGEEGSSHGVPAF
ncbi:unnamed protein product [Amoebophrya sp. A120]|nr:unnamed protein product [Amoebophrya sp. A120]|eukprot:GSA120T00019340001.1